MIPRVVLSLLVCLALTQAAAVPDFADRRRVAGVELIGDSDRPGIAYFVPPPLELVGGDGRPPGGELLLTRYTGSAVHGDSGEHFVRSLLRFRVRAPAFERPEQIRRELNLRPLPVVNTDTRIVAEGLSGEFVQGFFDSPRSDEATVFTEREFVLPLKPRTAEAFAAAIEAGGLVVSLAYTLWTEALPAEGAPDIGGAIPGDQGPSIPDREDTRQPQPLVARTGTLPVPVGQLRKIDLDLGAPPDYPSLRVYCFDFAQKLRADLFLKEVIFEAAAVAGGRTRYRVSFSRDHPEVTVRSVRFPFAVDIRQPYRFRVVEVGLDGAVARGPWRRRDNWASIVDVTSVPDHDSLQEDPP